MEIVERIKNLCNTENITIKELERIIQISNGSIRHWNEKTPSVERVLLVADHFNVSLDWLGTGKHRRSSFWLITIAGQMTEEGATL